MKNYNSVLRFNNYIVNEIKFKNNENFKQEKMGTPINLDIKPKIEINKNLMDVTLITEIYKDAAENNYPFEMMVSVTGKFSSEGEQPENFKKNAIAILYPYIRSIVSTYTASANINPLILPAININKLIEDQENNNKQED